MLSYSEETGLRNILNDFIDFDLFSLADTVTKRLLKTSSRNEAIDAIISCLEKPSDLLKRQKITKKVIFTYLLKIKPVVSPEHSKGELVQMCLDEWHSIELCKASDYENQKKVHPNRTEIECNNWLKVMGTQFSQWFFSLYNQLQGFGPEHFWVDCKLMGELKTPSDDNQVAIIGANEVVTFLSSLIINDKFYFHANATNDGTVTEQDPHGLVKISVSGVVHKLSNCIGLFDCSFGLVRNPAYNDNWKIKWIHMKIHVTSCARDLYLPMNQCQSICQKA